MFDGHISGTKILNSLILKINLFIIIYFFFNLNK